MSPAHPHEHCPPYVDLLGDTRKPHTHICKQSLLSSTHERSYTNDRAYSDVSVLCYPSLHSQIKETLKQLTYTEAIVEMFPEYFEHKIQNSWTSYPPLRSLGNQKMPNTSEIKYKDGILNFT